MTVHSPDSAQIRNVSIISLSRHRGQETAETLRDQICELADRTEIGTHQSAHNEAHDTLSAISGRRSPVEAVPLELEIGSRGNSLSSIFLLEDDHAKGKRAGNVRHSEMTSLKVNLITCLDRRPCRNAAAAVRVTDSILMVLGVDEHTSPLLPSTVQLAVREACKPVVFLDRLDEILFRHSGAMELEDVYQACERTISAVNAVIKHCRGRPSKVELDLDPRQNTVLFGSIAGKWGFSLADFAKLHAPELDVNAAELQKHLWGDFSFETSSKKWMPMVERSTEWGERAFNQFILTPMFEIRSAVIAAPDNPQPLASILRRLKVKLSADDERKCGRELFNAIMQAYIPIVTTLKGAIRQMPSLLDAQKYRAACLCSGPSGDEPTVGMVQCERVAPLLIYATHFIPAKSSRDKLYLLGRVFAGELASGADIHILGTGRHYGARPIDGIFAIAPGGTNIIRPVVQAAVGDLVLLTGIYEFMQGPGTICTSPRTPRLLDMYYTRPATKYSVKVTAPEILPSLVAGMEFLCKTDLHFESESTFSGENFIFGIDMSHIEACLNILRSFANDPLIVEGPLPIYRETVTAKSSQTAFSRSPNRFNRFYASATPIDEALMSAIEAGVISPLQQYKSRAAMLHADFSWDEKIAQKIWAFGPDNTGPNLVVDTTKAVQFLFEIRDAFVAGFQWAAAEGPLAGERLRGVRLNIEDMMLLSDAIHRGGGQIMSTARRVTFASMLLATPRLVEERYLVQVQMLRRHAIKVQETISQLPGVSFDSSSGGEHLTSNLWNAVIVQAFMPLKARLKLEALFQQDTELFQDVSIEFIQAGWQAAGDGDPLDQTSEAGKILIELRKEKGLPTEIDINNYLDRL